MIGYEVMGAGERRVIVLNDWLGDTSTWDAARAYLDDQSICWAFADLRGYGRSRGLTGRFTVEEAAADVLEVADALGWSRFAIVGHSMSTLVAVHLAQRHAARIERVVLLTPPPPTGFGADDRMLGSLVAMARGSDADRLNGWRAMSGDRLTERWLAFKIERWRACADPVAVAAYAVMFARDGVPEPTARIAAPVLAVTGEQDAPNMRRAAVTAALTPLCDQLVVASIADAGHYPMQEAPPLLVTIVERFLAGS